MSDTLTDRDNEILALCATLTDISVRLVANAPADSPTLINDVRALSDAIELLQTHCGDHELLDTCLSCGVIDPVGVEVMHLSTCELING